MFLKDYDYKSIVELENENFQNQFKNIINLYDQVKKFNNNRKIFRIIFRYEKNNYFSEWFWFIKNLLFMKENFCWILNLIIKLF